MPLKANALVTVEEAKSWLNVTGATDDAKLEDEINRASEALEAYCNRPLKKATYTNVRLMGGARPTLYLKAVPIDVAAALTISVDAVVQTVWKTEADGDPALKDVIVGSDDHTTLLGQQNHLWRGPGWGCPSYSNPYNVLLTYTGGLGTTPDDLKGAAFYVIQKLWRDRTKGLTDVTTISGPSGSINILDIAMPRWARQALDRFRVVAVG